MTASITFAQPPASAVDVRQLGARADSSADDSPPIQQALDGGGTVVIPAGSYRIARPLKIGSNTRLIAHPQAHINLADGVGKSWDDFLLSNRDPEGGDHDIEVIGGIWSGNNRNNPRSPRLIDIGTYSGVMINFRNVGSLRLADMMLCDAQSYYLRMSNVRQFLIERIQFHTFLPAANNDGVHLAGNCRDGTIRHIRGLGRGSTSDDIVALNADDAMERTECYGGEAGPIRNIRMYDLHADNCHTFIRLLSVVSPIENIDIDGITGGCDIAALNLDGARGCRVQVFDASDPKFARGVGMVANVRVTNMHVHKTAGNNVPLINLQQRVDEWILESFRRDTERDASESAPTLHAAHLPDQHVLLEGLTGEQAAQLAQGSSAPLKTQPLCLSQPRLGVAARAHVVYGQDLLLADGDIPRMRIVAGPNGVMSA